MYRHILGITIPPLAICRYGCANSCVLPITIFWVGGLAALAYHFFQAPVEYNWLYNGSLILGIAMIALSIIWTELTIARVVREGCDKSSGDKSGICGAVSGEQESDPFEEVRKAKEL